MKCKVYRFACNYCGGLAFVRIDNEKDSCKYNKDFEYLGTYEFDDEFLNQLYEQEPGEWHEAWEG